MFKKTEKEMDEAETRIANEKNRGLVFNDHIKFENRSNVNWTAFNHLNTRQVWLIPSCINKEWIRITGKRDWFQPFEYQTS